MSRVTGTLWVTVSLIVIFFTFWPEVSRGEVNLSHRTIEEKGTWTPPVSARPFVSLSRKLEKFYGMPRNLLLRVAYEESRFIPKVINCEIVSSVGAQGIMQINPNAHPPAPYCLPEFGLAYGAGYLRQQYDRFGNWEHALMAYNAGPTKISRMLKDGVRIPSSIRGYARRILTSLRIKRL